MGGLLFSQVITLYITPVIYTFLDECQTALRGWMLRIPGILSGRRNGPALPAHPSAGG